MVESEKSLVILLEFNFTWLAHYVQENKIYQILYFNKSKKKIHLMFLWNQFNNLTVYWPSKDVARNPYTSIYIQFFLEWIAIIILIEIELLNFMFSHATIFGMEFKFQFHDYDGRDERLLRIENWRCSNFLRWSPHPHVSEPIYKRFVLDDVSDVAISRPELCISFSCCPVKPLYAMPCRTTKAL